jgi:DNA-binding NarL/FixJ family response regulator
VLAADDHPLVRVGLATVLRAEPGLDLVAEASDGAEAVAAYRATRPDVVLMDLRMPRLDGVAATRAIVAEFAGARVLALTTYDGDADIERALAAGARGYLFKDMLGVEVVRAVHAVHAGERVIPAPVAQRLAEHALGQHLTEREQEVLELMGRGLTNREIAAAIGRTEQTVKTHVSSVLAKLGVADRVAAVAIAVRRGLLHLR